MSAWSVLFYATSLCCAALDFWWWSTLRSWFHSAVLCCTCGDVVQAAVPGHRQPRGSFPAAVNGLVLGVGLLAAVPGQILGLKATERRTHLDQVERHRGPTEHRAQLTEHLQRIKTQNVTFQMNMIILLLLTCWCCISKDTAERNSFRS